MKWSEKDMIIIGERRRSLSMDWNFNLVKRGGRCKSQSDGTLGSLEWKLEMVRKKKRNDGRVRYFIKWSLG